MKTNHLQISHHQLSSSRPLELKKKGVGGMKKYWHLAVSTPQSLSYEVLPLGFSPRMTQKDKG